MSLRKTNLILVALMLTASALATVLQPKKFFADARGQFVLEDAIPSEFSGWKKLSITEKQIINPQQEATLKKIYSQTVSRTYLSQDGEIVMLSIAYGRNQNDDVALHYPDVCYPAQGFRITKRETSEIKIDGHTIPTTKLIATLGTRIEPITYWTTIGNKTTRGSLNTKIAQLSYRFDGSVPDGLIFRVSSIGESSDKKYAAQESFIRSLEQAVSKKDKPAIFGLL